MKREVVQDFLNLPGIAGVALMDGHSRPYFYGLDQALNSRQREALAQGILQVVETTPDGFESFEFQFVGHQVFIYKLSRGIVLLVLADNILGRVDYLKGVALLRKTFQEDIHNAITTFKLLAGSLTQPSRNHWASSSSPSLPPLPALDPEPLAIPLEEKGQHAAEPTTVSGPLPMTALRPVPPLPPPIKSAASPTSLPVQPVIPLAASPPPPSLEDVVAALNHLSRFTSRYLGTAVIVNYWKVSRPKSEWLTQFNVERTGRVTFSGDATQFLPTHHQLIREWVKSFTRRCAQVLRDFPQMLDRDGLNERQKQILLDRPSLGDNG